MKKQFFFALLAVLVVVLTACGNNNDGNSDQSGQTNGSSSDQMDNQASDNGDQSDSDSSANGMTTIHLLKNDKVGNYLADNDGMTLYHFTRDEPGKSNCQEGVCLTNWPPLYGDVENLDIPSGFNKDDFGTITREDNGKKQITYKDYPLYHYSSDQKKGDVNGQNVNLGGGIWYIVNADTTFEEHNASSGDSDQGDSGTSNYSY